MKKVIALTFILTAGTILLLFFMLGYNFTIFQKTPYSKFDPYQSYTVIKETIGQLISTPYPTKEKISLPEITKSPQKKQSLPGNISAPTPVPTELWGVAEKIGDNTYTIKLADDEAMGAPQEILDALNHYRHTHGKSTLQWSDSLAQYSQVRADLFAQIESTDGHAGLNNFLDNEDGFVRLGFSRIGENSYFGGPLNGVHLIEWLFASSKGHDANQLDNSWSHAGIATTATSVNIIFAGGKF